MMQLKPRQNVQGLAHRDGALSQVSKRPIMNFKKGGTAMGMLLPIAGAGLGGYLGGALGGNYFTSGIGPVSGQTLGQVGGAAVGAGAGARAAGYSPSQALQTGALAGVGSAIGAAAQSAGRGNPIDENNPAMLPRGSADTMVPAGNAGDTYQFQPPGSFMNGAPDQRVLISTGDQGMVYAPSGAYGAAGFAGDAARFAMSPMGGGLAGAGLGGMAYGRMQQQNDSAARAAQARAAQDAATARHSGVDTAGNAINSPVYSPTDPLLAGSLAAYMGGDPLSTIPMRRKIIRAKDPRAAYEIGGFSPAPEYYVVAAEGGRIPGNTMIPHHIQLGAPHGRPFAEGGDIDMAEGPEGWTMDGESGGQADDVDAKLSVGEYVIPADVVSALGDGDTGSGSDKLDAMIKNIREHIRGAGLDGPKGQLPPMTRGPLEHMMKRRAA